jgi:hypothetical protein
LLAGAAGPEADAGEVLREGLHSLSEPAERHRALIGEAESYAASARRQLSAVAEQHAVAERRLTRVLDGATRIEDDEARLKAQVGRLETALASLDED